MDLRQLAALTAIADHGSFSAAARALYTVQSNVSGHVAHLERELGVTLVDRQRGGLTAEGFQVVERARRIQRELDGISAEMASRDTDVVGTTRLGVIGTTGRWVMPELLTRLATDHPRLRMTVFEGPSSALLTELLDGKIDAAVVHLPVDEPELSIEPLFAEDLMLLVHTRNPLSERTEVPLAELAQHPLVLAPPGTAFRRVVDRAATSAGVTLTAAAEIDGVRLLASMAYEGFGPAIVPATAVPRWLRGEFRVIRVPELPRRVVAWVQKRRPTASRPTRAARETTHAVLERIGSRQPGVHIGVDSPVRT
ncbi:MAG: LysR family transcriptional regulator [Ilumatobacteraceae bacterium]